jgi:ABC-type lipoprotein release transport system permease subunit
VSWLLTVAARNLARQRRRTAITATAMAVAVAVSMGVLAFQEGTFHTLFEVMVEQQLGHVEVAHPERALKRRLEDTVTGLEDLLRRLDALPGTAGAAPRLEGYALLGGPVKSAGGVLVGLDPARENAVSGIAERVVEGRMVSGSGEIALGAALAPILGVSLGDEVVAVTQSADGSLGNALYEVVGLIRTGNVGLDRSGGILVLTDLQELLALPDQAHGVRLVSHDPDAIGAFAAEVSGIVGAGAVARPWWEVSPMAAQMMDMRDFAAGIVLVIVLGAAAFGVLNTMMMSVFERTRELGLLGAVGVRPWMLVSLVLVESALLAALAGAAGLVLGGLLDAWLVFVGVDLSGRVKDGVSFAGVVLDPVIRGIVDPGLVALTVAGLFGVSLLASLWPAIRASRLQPVEALRAD